MFENVVMPLLVAIAWPTVSAPNSIDTKLVSATTSFFLLDQRNMERARPAEINLPADVQRRLEDTQKMAAATMMMGIKQRVPKKPSGPAGRGSGGTGSWASHRKNRPGREARMMRIAASMATKASEENDKGDDAGGQPERRRRAKQAAAASASSGLQNRFASRRSYIPMASSGSAEVRIDDIENNFNRPKPRADSQDIRKNKLRQSKASSAGYDVKAHIRNRFKDEIAAAKGKTNKGNLR